MRIAITGGPRTGKTTLAEKLYKEHAVCFVRHCAEPDVIRHTDDLIPLGWSEASQAACLWLDAPGPWIIEGVAVSRALRKWRDAHPGEPPPVDRVIYLTEPLNRGAVLAGQDRMAKGAASVHAEIEEWLAEHGVATERIAIQVFGDGQGPKIEELARKIAAAGGKTNAAYVNPEWLEIYPELAEHVTFVPVAKKPIDED